MLQAQAGILCPLSHKGNGQEALLSRREISGESFGAIFLQFNFCLFPCDMSQEPNGNCSEKLAQTNSLFFFWGGGGDSPPHNKNKSVEHPLSNVMFTRLIGK